MPGGQQFRRLGGHVVQAPPAQGLATPLDGLEALVVAVARAEKDVSHGGQPLAFAGSHEGGSPQRGSRVSRCWLDEELANVIQSDDPLVQLHVQGAAARECQPAGLSQHVPEVSLHEL